MRLNNEFHSAIQTEDNRDGVFLFSRINNANNAGPIRGFPVAAPLSPPPPPPPPPVHLWGIGILIPMD